MAVGVFESDVGGDTSGGTSLVNSAIPVPGSGADDRIGAGTARLWRICGEFIGANSRRASSPNEQGVRSVA